MLAVIAIILATLAYSWWKQLSYSILVSVTCVAVFILEFVQLDGGTRLLVDELLFMPGDLTEPAMLYTLLTSMYAHGGLTHLLFNVIAVVLIGMVLEQRIGTRPYIVLYLLTGLAGTLTFAAFHFDEPLIGVLGASGAISGVLGAFARLFPNERMSLFVMFVPLPPMPIWMVVAVFVGLQFLYSLGSTNIAWEAHLGGLLAGLLLAPVVVKMPIFRRAKRTVSRSSLRRLATTPELRSILSRIEHEDLPDVRSAWIEKFMSEARCPYCGSRLKPAKESIMCEKGHLL